MRLTRYCSMVAILSNSAQAGPIAIGLDDGRALDAVGPMLGERANRGLPGRCVVRIGATIVPRADGLP